MKNTLLLTSFVLFLALLPSVSHAQVNVCVGGGYGCPGYGFHPHHGYYGPVVAPRKPMKVWVRGHWAVGRFGRRRWIPPHWEIA